MNSRAKKTLGLVAAVVVGGLLASTAAGLAWLRAPNRSHARHGDNGAQRRPSNLPFECDPVVTSPRLRASELQLGAGDSLTVEFAGKATRCPGGTVSFFTRVGEGEETAQGTAIAGDDGTWSTSLTVADQARTAFTVQMTSAAGRTARTTAYVQADTSKAVVFVDSPATDDWGYARIMAADGCGGRGNSHVLAAEPGWLADASCDGGGQIDPSVTVRGASGGTLSVRYEPEGQAPIALASAAVTASPQTFTAAELGRLTLPDDTRGDIIFEVSAGAASSSNTVFLRVFTQRPAAVTAPRVKALGPNTVELSFVLPAQPANSPEVSIGVEWTKELTLASPEPETLYEIGTTPKLITAHGPARTVVHVGNWDESQPLYCAVDNPAVTPATATHIALPKSAGGVIGYATLDVTNAPCTGRWWPCNRAFKRKQVHCVRAAAATVPAARVSWDNWASDWANKRGMGDASPCVMRDPSATPQVWECNGRMYAPGDRFAMRIGGLTAGHYYEFRVAPEN